MITTKQALKIVLTNVRPLKTVRDPLNEVLGYCLAEDIRSGRDLPPTNRSAMDGYAVRAKDLAKSPRELRLVGEVAAGSAAKPRVTAGNCVRILTGAPVPPSTDAIVKVEETTESGDVVKFDSAIKAGTNIRLRGEEVTKGQIVLHKGDVLNSAQIGVCASVGKAAVKVYKRPDVTVLCTGRELKSPGEKVEPYQLFNSNGPSLIAALKGAGIRKVKHQIVPDDPKILVSRLKTAVKNFNVVILTGGVSVGKYDFVPQAIKAVGAKVRFHGVAMKPGKPQLYATMSGNRHIFGLPGNPLSVMTGFGELVLPAIRRLSGHDAASCRVAIKLPLNRPVKNKAIPRAAFVLGKLIWSPKGLCVEPVASCGSADLVAGAQADGVIHIPRDIQKISAGELVEFTPWRPIP